LSQKSTPGTAPPYTAPHSAFMKSVNRNSLQH